MLRATSTIRKIMNTPAMTMTCTASSLTPPPLDRANNRACGAGTARRARDRSRRGRVGTTSRPAGDNRTADTARVRQGHVHPARTTMDRSIGEVLRIVIVIVAADRGG